VLVGVAAGYLYYVASGMEFAARPGTLGPDFWPKLILALIILACAYEVVKILVFRGGAQVEGVLGEIVDDVSVDPQVPLAMPEATRRPWLLLGGIGVTIAYVAFVQTLGFFTATIVYLASFIVIGGYRRWRVIAAVSLLGTLLMLFFFMKVVYVSLPLGTGVFQHITLFLMRILGVR
jgi:putative tricarboxylic transport membrane protein